MSVNIMEELLMVLQTSISNLILTIKDFHVLHKVVMVDHLQVDQVNTLQLYMVFPLQVDLLKVDPFQVDPNQLGIVVPLQVDMVDLHQVEILAPLQVDLNSLHNMLSSLNIHIPRGQMIFQLWVLMASQTHPK